MRYLFFSMIAFGLAVASAFASTPSLDGEELETLRDAYGQMPKIRDLQELEALGERVNRSPAIDGPAIVDASPQEESGDSAARPDSTTDKTL